VALYEDLFTLMQQHGSDFTLTFRYLADLADTATTANEGLGSLFSLPDAFTPWLTRWQQRLSLDTQSNHERQAGMYQVNPAYIPRNHLVEAAIHAALKEQDFKPFHAMVDLLHQPFVYEPSRAADAMPPSHEQVVTQTFCGT